MRHPLFVKSLRALALVAVPALAAFGSAQTLLRFKPPVGKSASYTMTMTMSQSMAGMAAPMTITTTMPMTMRVVSRSGKNTVLETKAGQAKVSVPANSPMAGMKAAMEKASSNVATKSTVDELGNVKGLDASGTGAGAAMAKQMSTGMMQGAQGVSFPAKALKVGDTWSANLDMGKMMGGMGGGGMKMSGNIPITYRLTALSGGVATIAITMKGAPSMNANGQTIKMNISATGKTVVEAATGFMRSTGMVSDTAIQFGAQTMKQHMVMSMKAR